MNWYYLKIKPEIVSDSLVKLSVEAEGAFLVTPSQTLLLHIKLIDQKPLLNLQLQCEGVIL